MSSSRSISARSTSQTSEDKELIHMWDVLNDVKKSRAPLQLPGSAVKKDITAPMQCIRCGKSIPASDVLYCRSTPPSRIHPPLVSSVPLCGACLQSVSGMASVVCIGCKEVMLFIPPNTDKDGFKVEKDKTYHILSCPACDKQLKEQVEKGDKPQVRLIEKLVHEKR